MATAAFESAGSGVPDWTSKDEKRGIDPLGMQTTSVALYQELLPGISNVTLRMRYYGFYCWLAQSYAKDVGDTAVDTWCLYIRRAEALYALVAANAGNEKGVAGVLWAGRKLSVTSGSRVVFRLNTDRGDEPQYLKQKFGAFGAAYGSQLFAIGLLVEGADHDIPIPSDDIGRQLAQAFNAAIGVVGAAFLAAAKLGSVTKGELANMVSMLPSHIGKGTRERQLYQSILFAKTGPNSDSAFARSQSLRLVLRAAQFSGENVDAPYVRWSLYAKRAANGEPYGELPAHEEKQRFYWAVYQANDLLHLAYEALLKFTLDVLSVPPTGMALADLVNKVSAKLTKALSGYQADTWMELVNGLKLSANAWSDESPLSESSLADAILADNDLTSLGSEDFAVSAVILLAILHKRWMAMLDRIVAERPTAVESAFSRSIVTELRFLDAHSSDPLPELFARLVKTRIVERHLWVAVQKFRGQGDYTFLLESDEGKVRLRQKDGPVFTNPRLASAINFLRDIHLLGNNGPTKAGLQALEFI